MAFMAFSEFQFHTREELDACDRVIVIQLVLLTKHIVNQRKGCDLIVHLIVCAEAEVQNILQLLCRVS